MAKIDINTIRGRSWLDAAATPIKATAVMVESAAVVVNICSSRQSRFQT